MSQLRKKLEPFDLHEVGKLAKALDKKKQWASFLLNGNSFGPQAAMSISAAIKRTTGVDIPWSTVYEWQNHKRTKEG